MASEREWLEAAGWTLWSENPDAETFYYEAPFGHVYCESDARTIQFAIAAAREEGRESLIAWLDSSGYTKVVEAIRARKTHE